MSLDHRGNTQPLIDNEEHTHESGIGAKKITLIPHIINQQLSLVSGYKYYGFANPGTDESSNDWRIMREEVVTGSLRFASGKPTFSHAWSSASLASISYS